MAVFAEHAWTHMPLSSLTCPNCNATLKSKTPVPEGARLKCPKCAAMFTAQGNGGAPPSTGAPKPAAAAPKPKPAPAAKEEPLEITEAIDDEADGADEVEAPRKPKRKNKKKGVPVWVWPAVGGGVFVLCCCPVGLGGGYFAMYGLPNVGGINVNQAHLDLIKKDITEAQVEQIMGGKPTGIGPMVANYRGDEWRSGKDFIVVGFENGKGVDTTFHFTLASGAEMSGTLPLQ
jgi:hypothetical protein